jgi:hypothetical protein
LEPSVNDYLQKKYASQSESMKALEQVERNIDTLGTSNLAQTEQHAETSLIDGESEKKPDATFKNLRSVLECISVFCGTALFDTAAEESGQSIEEYLDDLLLDVNYSLYTLGSKIVDNTAVGCDANSESATILRFTLKAVRNIIRLDTCREYFEDSGFFPTLFYKVDPLRENLCREFIPVVTSLLTTGDGMIALKFRKSRRFYESPSFMFLPIAQICYHGMFSQDLV